MGEGIAAADVDREDVFLSTKAWRSNLASDDVHRTVRESLDGLDVSLSDEEMARIRDRGGNLGLRLRNRPPAHQRRWPL